MIAATQRTGEQLETCSSAEPRLGSFAVDNLGGFTVAPSSVGERLPRSVTSVPLTDQLPAAELVVVWRPETTSPAAYLVVETARKLAAVNLTPDRWEEP